MTEVTSLFFAAAAILALLLLIAVIRIVRGKTAPDRVVALDTMNTIVVGVMIGLSAAFRTVVYVDIAIVYTLLSFIATIYIADYVGGNR